MIGRGLYEQMKNPSGRIKMAKFTRQSILEALNGRSPRIQDVTIFSAHKIFLDKALKLIGL